MLYNTLVVVVAIVLAIAATYTFGWICYKQGHYAGFNDGNKAGYAAGRAIEKLEAKWAAREAITANLKDDACVKLFDEILDELNICPVCMDAPAVKGHGACNGCLCDLYADDPRSIRYAQGLGDDDGGHTAPIDVPF